MSDSQKSRSWLSRFVRSRLAIVLTTAVIASGLGGTAAAVASNSKAKTQGPVAVKGPPLGTFTTTSGDSPTFPTAGTYFVVVNIGIENQADSPLRGSCGAAQVSSGGAVPGFASAFIVQSGPGVVSGFTFSGMVVVAASNAPATLFIQCMNEAGQKVPHQGVTWWVEKVNT
jgi:hypothetical protein